MLTQAQFLDVMRQYASAARRKRASYADAVHRFALERARTIALEEPDMDKRARRLSDLQDMLAREYAPNDPQFEARSYD